ncbi:unnamed protein product [Rhizophagus irregularis]|nr:unnamed protein product [Rhizophagus irregularis]
MGTHDSPAINVIFFLLEAPNPNFSIILKHSKSRFSFLRAVQLLQSISYNVHAGVVYPVQSTFLGVHFGEQRVTSYVKTNNFSTLKIHCFRLNHTDT